MTWLPRSLYRARRLLLLVGLVLLTASITQCRMVTDSLVRAQVEESKANGCLRRCNEAAKDAREDERERHQEAREDCGKDPQCKAQEDARHAAELAAIEERRKACQNGCHHQGGGRGGR